MCTLIDSLALPDCPCVTFQEPCALRKLAETSHRSGEEADAGVNNDVAGSSSAEAAGFHQPLVSSMKLQFMSVYFHLFEEASSMLPILPLIKLCFAWLDFVSLHDIDFKQSLRCTCAGNEGVPKRIGADGMMLGCQQQKVNRHWQAVCLRVHLLR